MIKNELDSTLFTKSGKPRKRKPKQKNVYFTEETQEAILQYNLETDQAKKNLLYNSKIEFAFFKLTQNIINTYKLYSAGNSIEDLQQEVIEHILQKLHLFDPEKGKAYSYFGTIIKRYFLAKNKKAYVRMIEHVDFDNSIVEFSSTYAESFDVEPYDLDTVIKEFVEYCNTNIPVIFSTQEDINIAKSVLYFFERIDHIEVIFNKKAMLLYLRELNPGADNMRINNVLKQMYDIYKGINLQYIAD